MKLLLLNFCPNDITSNYMLSSYVLKAYVKKYYTGLIDLEVEVFNFSYGESFDVIINKIISKHPNIIGYSCYVWNIDKVIKVINTLKKVIDTTSILGGPEISVSKIKLLSKQSNADYYIIGAGERKLVKLLEYIASIKIGIKLNVPIGIICNDNLTDLQDIQSDIIEDLDEIPSIYISGTIEENLYSFQNAYIETQRGCKYRCKYCTYNKSLPSVYYYSINRIKQELEYLIIEGKVRSIRILDAIFTTDLNRAKEIVKHLINIKEKASVFPNIFWEYFYDDVDEEFIRLTAALKSDVDINNFLSITPLNRPQFYSEMLKGYTVINAIGLQSFNQQALKSIARKVVNIDRLEKFLNMVKEYNIVMKIDLILGLPYETFSSYISGLDYIIMQLKNTDHVINIHRLQVLPGSMLEELCDKFGIIYSADTQQIVNATPWFSTEEINYATKLSAIIFRIVNSPMRSDFFEFIEKKGIIPSEFANLILNRMSNLTEFKDVELIKNDSVCDEYWNERIFYDIQTQWIRDYLYNS